MARLPLGRRTLAHPFTRPLLFLAMHVPLALLMRASSLFSSLHAYGTFVLGLLWILGSKRIDRGVYVTAYVVGSELLWRGTGARVFYETGKYGLALFCGLLLLRSGRLGRADKMPLVYFLLLLPSLSVMSRFDRELISFNLSGPLSLAVATMFFSTVRVNRSHLEGIYLAMLGPIVGLAAIGTRATMSASSLELIASTKVTTGGIGPNQVSSMLGLGSLLAVLLLIAHRQAKTMRLVLIAIAFWLTGQNLLTFSRGGFWASIGAIAVAIFYLLRDRRFRAAVLLRTSLLVVVGLLLILPALDSLTGGNLSKRFQDFQPTGRDRILRADLDAFMSNPVFGIGPGGSKEHHRKYALKVVAHTEFSRLFAEHGVFGILSLSILMAMALRRWLQPLPVAARAMKMSHTAWALLFMLHSAMRLSACSFLFALGAMTLVLTPPGRPSPARPPAATAPWPHAASRPVVGTAGKPAA